MRHKLIAVAGGAVLVVGAVAAPAAAQTDHAEVEAKLQVFHDNSGPGAAVYFGDESDETTFSRGTAKVFDQRDITAADHFRIGSQTKTFTAVTVLQLVDEGLVELDEPIETYLPGVLTGDFDGNEITVRQLLDHSSGLPRDVLAGGGAPNQNQTYELADLVATAQEQQPQAAPGAAWNYSNVGYLVLGMLLEERTGQFVGDAITERVIQPLGLTDTAFPTPGVRALGEPFVPGYWGGKFLGFFFWNNSTTDIELTAWSTNGAMESTLADLSTFYRALLDGELLSDAALGEMRTVFDGSPYGLGIGQFATSCDVTAWGHNGALGTGHYSMTVATDDGRFASIVTNTMGLADRQAGMELIDTAICADA